MATRRVRRLVFIGALVLSTFMLQQPMQRSLLDVGRGILTSQVPPVYAQDGMVLATRSTGSGCGPIGSSNPGGVGLAFDGFSLWYSCQDSATLDDLYEASIDDGGFSFGSCRVAGGLGGLAWDGNRNMIWAAWGSGPNGVGQVRLIRPSDCVFSDLVPSPNALDLAIRAGDAVELAATTTSTLQVAPIFSFNLSAVCPNCGTLGNVSPGIAYDAQTDTLYIATGSGNTIAHVRIGNADTIELPPTALTMSTPVSLIRSFVSVGPASCAVKGLAIGGSHLWQSGVGATSSDTACGGLADIWKGDSALEFRFANSASMPRV